MRTEGLAFAAPGSRLGLALKIPRADRGCAPFLLAGGLVGLQAANLFKNSTQAPSVEFAQHLETYPRCASAIAFHERCVFPVTAKSPLQRLRCIRMAANKVTAVRAGLY